MRTADYGGHHRGGIQAARITPTALPGLWGRDRRGVNIFCIVLSGFKPWKVEICEAAHVSHSVKCSPRGIYSTNKLVSLPGSRSDQALINTHHPKFHGDGTVMVFADRHGFGLKYT